MWKPGQKSNCHCAHLRIIETCEPKYHSFLLVNAFQITTTPALFRFTQVNDPIPVTVHASQPHIDELMNINDLRPIFRVI